MQALGEINWTSKENKNFADFENRLPLQMKIMDCLNIKYANRDAYLVRGFKNWSRAFKAWLKIFKNLPKLYTYIERFFLISSHFNICDKQY